MVLPSSLGPLNHVLSTGHRRLGVCRCLNLQPLSMALPASVVTSPRSRGEQVLGRNSARQGAQHKRQGASQGRADAGVDMDRCTGRQTSLKATEGEEAGRQYGGKDVSKKIIFVQHPARVCYDRGIELQPLLREVASQRRSVSAASPITLQGSGRLLMPACDLALLPPGSGLF